MRWRWHPPLPGCGPGEDLDWRGLQPVPRSTPGAMPGVPWPRFTSSWIYTYAESRWHGPRSEHPEAICQVFECLQICFRSAIASTSFCADVLFVPVDIHPIINIKKKHIKNRLKLLKIFLVINLYPSGCKFLLIRNKGSETEIFLNDFLSGAN